MLRADVPAPPAPPAPSTIDEILEVVRCRCGTPFAGYRRPTLERRILNRMISAGAPTAESYLARLRADPDEPGRLLERLTLKVSRFWRNAEAVAAVASALARRGAPAAPLRAWSAGCAHGEEAYTLAFLLAGAGAGAWSVVGTDVDPSALAAAERARYAPAALAELPGEAARRHLSPPGAGGARAVIGPARAGVRFERHDLVTAEAPPAGAPFGLVACRNVVIYLEDSARARVERLLLGALAPGGLLWLGEAEWPGPSLAGRLEVLDRRARLFRRGEGE